VSSNLIMYADDSTLYRHIKSFQDEVLLQKDLNNIVLWSVNNGMKLNASKCTFMDVTLSNLRRFGLYKIDDTSLSHADYIKILGVYVAYNLSWNVHVNYICAKSAKLLGFVSRNLRDCSPRIKCQAFTSLIRPIMVHGAPGWHPTSEQNLTKLQRIQNRASRFAFGKSYTHKMDSHILCVRSHFKYIDLLYFYQCQNNLIDCEITNSVRTGRAIRGQEGVNRLIAPKVRTALYQSGFVYRTVDMWNQLPAEIKMSDFLNFKCKIKLHLSP
jgi:hypothetical protein